MGRNYPDDWGYHCHLRHIFFCIPDANSIMLEQKLREFLIDYYGTNLSSKACYADASTNPLELHALREVYFNEGLANDTTNRGNILQIRILIAVGIIIMLLSIINYINLYVAKATTRAKEIGIQKVCGSSKRSLSIPIFNRNNNTKLYCSNHRINYCRINPARVQSIHEFKPNPEIHTFIFADDHSRSNFTGNYCWDLSCIYHEFPGNCKHS